MVVDPFLGPRPVTTRGAPFEQGVPPVAEMDPTLDPRPVTTPDVPLEQGVVQ